MVPKAGLTFWPIGHVVAGKTKFECKLGNTLEIEIEPTDLLFIDTLHTYDQLIKELELHGNKSKKFIIIHDTETFGGNKKKKGLEHAYKEFLTNNENWSLLEHFANNNGLTVLKRVIL